MDLKQQRDKLSDELERLPPEARAESLRRLQLSAMEHLFGVLKPVLPKRSVNIESLLRLLD